MCCVLCTYDDELMCCSLMQGQTVFPLYNAGVCVARNCRACPCTYRTLLSLRTFISSNSLGSAGFWLLGPGATLGGAYGPTNTRLRCHLGKSQHWNTENSSAQNYCWGQEIIKNKVFKMQVRHWVKEITPKTFPKITTLSPYEKLCLTRLCPLREVLLL